MFIRTANVTASALKTVMSTLKIAFCNHNIMFAPIMKNKYSLFACLLIFIVAAVHRYHYYHQFSKAHPFSHLTYDAFGYYMYLPSAIIYGDMTSADWIAPMDSLYGVKGGGELYQTILEDNGNHVFKYLGGVALLQMPFFLIAHWTAPALGYPADGFSLPYQLGIVAATFFYAFLGLWLLRRLLLYYFDDTVAALTLIMVALGTNWLQYVTVDSALSHAYIFPLYALILLLSRKWHETPAATTAFAIGWVIGLATMSRPTEAIMLFIPLLWNTQNKDAAREKWALVAANKKQLIWAVAGGLAGVLPQLIYWKYAAGSFIYDVGSKWYFLNPWFRVLFGFEKGWFIYTPVTIFFVAGFWFLKNRPFQRSVIVFCLLNLWIITAWADWKYGASYSCRALLQSYPVFALAFAGVAGHFLKSRWRPAVWAVCAYFLVLNLIQIYQYNNGILRYDENSFELYRRVYMNPF